MMPPASGKSGRASSTRKRRRAWRYGKRSEWLCLWLLRLKGYRILATNLRLTGGELDIIARRGKTVAFIEVKARRTLEDARGAIGARQQQRLIAAAHEYLGHRPALADCYGRFDALLLAPRKFPVHIRDAWRDE